MHTSHLFQNGSTWTSCEILGVFCNTKILINFSNPCKILTVLQFYNASHKWISILIILQQIWYEKSKVKSIQLPTLWQYGLSSFQKIFAYVYLCQKSSESFSSFFDKINYYINLLLFIMMPYFWKLAINPNLEIQSFTLGLLIPMQKSLQFSTPALKLHLQ